MSTSPEHLYALARERFAANELAAASAACAELCEVAPGNPTYSVLSAEVSLALGSPGAAVDVLKRLSPENATGARYFEILGLAYRSLGWREAALQSLQKAARLDPTSLKALQTAGDLLFENGERADACATYEKALALDPTLEDALLRVNDFYSEIVPSWHFPMMNDAIRNGAFDRALRRVVRPDSVVLDIGTGAGLLAMMAARAGASHVYTCEVIPMVARVASQIVANNGYSEKITVINKFSRDLVVGTDLPRKADVLVTETVDNGLLGEETMAIIEHAREYLLTPEAAFMPIGAEVHAACIECGELFGRHRVYATSGFQLSEFNKFASTRYTGYFLNKYDHAFLTKEREVLRFDFAAQEKRRDLTFDLPVTRSGTIHAVVFWFVLHLDGESRFDTGPHAPMSCFEQPVQVLTPTFEVEAGDTVRMRVRHDTRRIWFDVSSS